MLIFLKGRSSCQRLILLLCFACFLCHIVCGLPEDVEVQELGLIKLYKVKLWINGTSALWGKCQNLSASFHKALLMDGGIVTYPDYLTFSMTPHTATSYESPESYPLQSDGIGMDVVVLFRESDMNYSTFFDNINKSKLMHVNELVNETFKQPVIALRRLPTTELFISNATIGIGNATKLWESYLANPKIWKPKERVFHAPNEVLEYMPIDLQNALHVNQSYYQIMSTSLWTNATGAYINYTVYAAPKIPEKFFLTPEEIRNRLNHSTLPRFTEGIRRFMQAEGQFEQFAELLREPLTIGTPLPPKYDPSNSSESLSTLDYLDRVDVKFFIRFSGHSITWENVLRTESLRFTQGLKRILKEVLQRPLYVTDLRIKKLKPIKAFNEKFGGLLVFGELSQRRTIMSQFPWDANDIIAVASQANYSEIFSLFQEQGEPRPSFVAVGLDTHFGNAPTVHEMAIIFIPSVVAGLTVFLILVFLIHIYFRAQGTPDDTGVLDIFDKDHEVHL